MLKQCLADLLGGDAPPHDVALMGPRGNGKTVLLNWFDRACRETGRLDVVRVLPSRIGTGQAVADALLPVSVIRRILPGKLGVTGVGHAEWAAPEPSAQDLTVRCRRKPVVALVDEAHTLARDVGQLLLNVSQEVRANAPFLLVLAGTPGLPAHLGTMNASFWSRLGEGRLGIGLLREAATRTALFEPAGGSWSEHRSRRPRRGRRAQPALSVLHPALASGAKRFGSGAWPAARRA